MPCRIGAGKRFECSTAAREKQKQGGFLQSVVFLQRKVGVCAVGLLWSYIKYMTKNSYLLHYC